MMNRPGAMIRPVSSVIFSVEIVDDSVAVLNMTFPSLYANSVLLVLSFMVSVDEI